ncbi:MAG TPA: hypothetical protein VEI07_00435 [Planctomycetaceae bacterium]|nr:hypothetical protein [Planctomycetaceae bacterium]
MSRCWRTCRCPLRTTHFPVIGCLLVVGTVLVVAGSAVAGQPPLQEPVAVKLGPKAYQDGDIIEITNVTATSPKLEQGDSLTVEGRVRLRSHESALLCLSVTQTEGDGRDVGDGPESLRIKMKQRNFSLKIAIKHRGPLHLTMYDAKTGRPFGGTYFGTADQMKKIADWKLAYYLAK